MVFLKNPKKVLKQEIVYKTRRGTKAKKIADATHVEVQIPDGKRGYKKKTLKLDVPKKLKTAKAKEAFIREETHRLLKAEFDRKVKASKARAKKQGKKYAPVPKLKPIKKKISAQQITDRVLEDASRPKKKQKGIVGWREKTEELIPVIRRSDKQRYFITKHEITLPAKIQLQDKDGFTQSIVYSVIEEMLSQKLHEIFQPGARYYVRILNEGRTEYLKTPTSTGRKKKRPKGDTLQEGFSLPTTTPIKNKKALEAFIKHFMEEYINAMEVYLAGALGDFYFRGVCIDEYREV